MQQLRSENDILDVIQQDPWMMEILRTVQSLNLPDWWIGAGFVRGKVWDTLHGFTHKTLIPDIDVIYFDPTNLTQEKEEEIKKALEKLNPYTNWQVKNQARMHIMHNDPPYQNATDALSRWVETATCVGVTIDSNGQLQLSAPLGIEDLTQLIVRPNPTIPLDLTLFKKRVRQKHWLILWPNLRVVYN